MNKYFVFLLAGFLVISSCSITRRYSTTTVPKEELKPIGSGKLYKKIQQNELDYNTIDVANFKATFDQNGSRKSFRGSYRIKKDSLIWLSINMFGIEFIRAQFTLDSIAILNRIEKTYTTTSYNFFEKKLGLNISYEMLQSILTNQFFLYPESDKHKDLEVEVSNHNTFLIKNNSKENITQDIYIKNVLFKVDTMKISDLSHNRELYLVYSNFNKTSDYMYPYSTTVEIREQYRQIYFEINCNKINFNKPITFPFTVSKKYQKIRG